MSNYETLQACRICAGEVKSVYNLGLLYPSAFLSEFDNVPAKAPLDLVQCQSCGLIQLGHTVELDSMYRTYFYRSSVNPTMVAALQDVADSVLDRASLKLGDVVVDTGSNDGTLLSMYPDFVTKVGFEPSLNLTKVFEPDYAINDYFSAKNYPLELPKAKVVTSLAMFYDLPDPVQFVEDVKLVLAPDGLWVVQLSDLRSMLEFNIIENVCFEHLEYYRTSDIVNLMSRAGLEVFRIERNDVNGGSLRYYIRWESGLPLEVSVAQTLYDEMEYFESPEGSIEAFKARITFARDTLLQWLQRCKAEGLSVYGLGASTKANTLLQYFEIDRHLIASIGDLNPDKFGKLMIGSDVPIQSESDVMVSNPDALIIFVWHFLPFFLERLQSYMRSGGVVVVPLPVPTCYFIEPDEPSVTYHAPLHIVLDEAYHGD